MKCLLLGAGFSKNWDGYLAEELQGSLLTLLQENEKLSELLNDNANFEAVLEQVQDEYKNDPTENNKKCLDLLQKAIILVFNRMNKGFVEKIDMEFSNHVEFSIKRFLCKFDVIFTLNQDLLFELFYVITTCGWPHWADPLFPGMSRPPRKIEVSTLEEIWHPIPHVNIEAEIKRNKACQPIIKLHGSVNWRNSQGKNLLVMGGSKMTMIEGQGLLAQYYEYFRKTLNDKNVKLMIIGYGFNDKHINEAIETAWNVSKIKIFVSSPSGDKRLKENIKSIRCAGKSTRLLKDIFAGDRAGLNDLEEFLKD